MQSSGRAPTLGAIAEQTKSSWARLITYLSTIMSRKVGILAAIVYAQDPAWDPEGHDVGKGY
jgi:hypothetical protein